MASPSHGMLWMQAAYTFHETLAAKCVKNAHVVDMFCCNLDQASYPPHVHTHTMPSSGRA